jgi:hypothetical protein
LQAGIDAEDAGGSWHVQFRDPPPLSA